jgi:hypothetical protein
MMAIKIAPPTVRTEPYGRRRGYLPERTLLVGGRLLMCWRLARLGWLSHVVGLGYSARRHR